MCFVHVSKWRRAMKCLICEKERVHNSALCKYHELAKRELESNYKAWKEAYGKISWREYLEKVRNNEETGNWVKDLIDKVIYNNDKKES